MSDDSGADDDGVPAEEASGDAERVAVEGLADCEVDDAFDAEDPPPGVVPKGGRLLEDLAKVLSRAGLTVKEVDGWQQRSRSGNGFPPEGPAGIIVHHTASSTAWNGQRDVNFMTFDCDVRPMANLYIDRGGTWWVLSAGATNTNGKGGPWGPIPANSANSRVIGIEAGNNGIGEVWPEVMQEAYLKGVAALADAYGVKPGNILGHCEWAPTRKIDPAGPSRFGSINRSGSWNMATFRSAVDKIRGGSGTAPTPAQPPPAPKVGATYTVQPGDSWWAIAKRTLGDPAATWSGIAAANGGAGRQLHPGDVLTIPGAKPASTTQPASPPPKPAPPPAGIPPFPGTAKRPDRGPVVLAWQRALIAKRVIADTPGNRDSFFGDGMHRAVLELQRSWKWSDADGAGGPHTWSKLHGGP